MREGKERRQRWRSWSARLGCRSSHPGGRVPQEELGRSHQVQDHHWVGVAIGWVWPRGGCGHGCAWCKSVCIYVWWSWAIPQLNDAIVVGHTPPLAMCRVLSIQQIAHQVLEGLACLNRHGLVHRALSPENVLLTAEVSWCVGLHSTVTCSPSPVPTPPLPFPHTGSSEVAQFWSLLHDRWWKGRRLPHRVRERCTVTTPPWPRPSTPFVFTPTPHYPHSLPSRPSAIHATLHLKSLLVESGRPLPVGQR